MSVGCNSDDKAMNKYLFAVVCDISKVNCKMSCDNGGGGHAPVWLYLDHVEYVTGIVHLVRSLLFFTASKSVLIVISACQAEVDNVVGAECLYCGDSDDPVHCQPFIPQGKV